MQIAISTWEYGSPLVKDTHLKGCGSGKYEKAIRHGETFTNSQLYYRLDWETILSCVVLFLLYLIKNPPQ